MSETSRPSTRAHGARAPISSGAIRAISPPKERAKPAERKALTSPGIDDFLAAAKKYYGFEPTRISEREFKRRYAEESLALGLTKEQVVRVYALETGGNGTADMQF